MIERMSVTDELTACTNRRGFVILAGQHQELAIRESSPFAIMFADLNGLKKLNDSMGHAVGDRALRKVATVLKASVRDADIVARRGGDEFVILLHHADPTNADPVGARVRQRLSEDTTPGEGVAAVSVSIGTASYSPDHPASVADLLVEADRNMWTSSDNVRRPANEVSRVFLAQSLVVGGLQSAKPSNWFRRARALRPTFDLHGEHLEIGRVDVGHESPFFHMSTWKPRDVSSVPRASPTGCVASADHDMPSARNTNRVMHAAAA
jgi:diguanylate cyclase (GGDEF)-like protein